ncbi:MAG: bifunctional demethylmenaquinone methyltransferase/2-methoxy-6-polyprenyl-1,4-benzoquinol methylase UbiE [Planctomyces sp.]
MPVDKTGNRIRQMFGEIAGRYDFMNHFLSAGTDIYWRWQAVRRAAPFNSAPLLDVCTGTGDLAFAFRKKIGPDVSIIGTDFTHGMLRRAEEKSQNLNCAGNVAFLEADTLSLPFNDNTFQVVSVAFGLRNVSSTIGGLKEMTRVCQPGGKVLVLEFSIPGNRLFSRVYQWYFRNILPRLGQLLVQNRQAAYEYLPQSVAEFPNGEQLTGLMEEAGLERTSFTPLTGGIATLYLGYKPSETRH